MSARSSLLPALLLPLLLQSAQAQTADGELAERDRWTHFRGPASGSGGTLEKPPASLGKIEWSFKTRGKDVLLGPPLTWDGVAFLIVGTRKKARLVALDTETGAKLATAALKTDGVPRPAVGNRSVFLIEKNTLVERLLQRKRFLRRWTYTVGPAASPPCVHKNEIYVATASGLLRLRSGQRRAVWKAKGNFFGRPALFGRHVYALRKGSGETPVLAAYDRVSGKQAATVELPHKAAAGGGRVAVAAGIVAAQLPPTSKRQWCLVKRTAKDDTLVLSEPKLHTFKTHPVLWDDRALGLDQDGDWVSVSLKGRGGKVIKKEDRKDLVLGAASPVRFRGGVGFGSWMLEAGTMNILWHVKERPDLKDLQAGTRFGPVRAGNLVLLVTRKGKALHALGEEKIG